MPVGTMYLQREAADPRRDSIFDCQLQGIVRLDTDGYEHIAKGTMILSTSGIARMHHSPSERKRSKLTISFSSPGNPGNVVSPTRETMVTLRPTHNCGYLCWIDSSRTPPGLHIGDLLGFQRQLFDRVRISSLLTCIGQQESTAERTTKQS
jgi:hypothetical protein